MLKFISIILSFFALNNYFSNSQITPNYCRIAGELLLCANFDSFTQLNFNNIQLDPNTKIKYISFRASSEAQVILDSSLDLSSLNGKIDNNYQVILEKISGIDILANPFLQIGLLANNLAFESSKFELFHENSQITLEKCNNLLQNTAFLSLSMTATSIYFSNSNYTRIPVCQVFFRDAKLKNFELKNIRKNNLFSFFKGVNITQSFRSVIENFDILESDFEFDDNILDKNIFKNTSHIRIKRSYVRDIQKNLFRPLTELKSLELELFNFDEAINTSKNWLYSLNADLKVDLNDINEFNSSKDRAFHLLLTDLNKTYEFAEKDFCLFKDFPHEKLILPIINTRDNLPCSCTLLWLLKHKKLYDLNNQNIMNTPSTRACFSVSNFDDIIEACDFSERVENCYAKSDPDKGINKVSYVYYLFMVLLCVTTLTLIVVVIVVVVKSKRKADKYGMNF